MFFFVVAISVSLFYPNLCKHFGPVHFTGFFYRDLSALWEVSVRKLFPFLSDVFYNLV